MEFKRIYTIRRPSPILFNVATGRNINVNEIIETRFT